jgi:hypothetical protein
MGFVLIVVLALVFTLVSGTFGYWYAIWAGGRTFWFSIPPVSWIVGGLLWATVFMIVQWRKRWEMGDRAEKERWWLSITVFLLMMPVIFFQMTRLRFMSSAVAYAGYWIDVFVLVLAMARFVMGLPIPPQRTRNQEAQ